jgi:hypothetical protein
MNQLQSLVSSPHSWAMPLQLVTAGQGRESVLIESRFSGNWRQPLQPSADRSNKSTQEILFDALAAFKIFTSQVAMHLNVESRDKLFKQLDLLLDPDEWPPEDIPPELASYRTLLRTLLVLAPRKIPGLGASSGGRLVAAWSTRDDRLTIQCLPNDRLRWSLSVRDGSERRAAAAESSLKHLIPEIAPYGPERWFS